MPVITAMTATEASARVRFSMSVPAWRGEARPSYLIGLMRDALRSRQLSFFHALAGKVRRGRRCYSAKVGSGDSSGNMGGAALNSSRRDTPCSPRT